MQNQGITDSCPAPTQTNFVPGVGLHGAPIYLQPATIRCESYRAKQSSGLGVTQIVLGSLCIVFNAISAAIGVYYSMSFVGHGFWCGILFIVTGGLGISAGINKTKCKIVSYMVLCIISACFTTALLTCGILGSIISGAFSDYGCRNYGYSYYYYYYYQPCPNFSLIAAMEGCMAVCGLIAAILFIWGATLACKSKLCACSCCKCCNCCCCKLDNQMQTMTIPINYLGLPTNVQTMQVMPYPLATMPYQQGMMAAAAMPPAYQTVYTHPYSIPTIQAAVGGEAMMATEGHQQDPQKQ